MGQERPNSTPPEGVDVAEGIVQYGELAKYYDTLYSWKDYAAEARTLLRLVRRYKESRGRSLLDVGCGTGQHIKHLKSAFDCVGLDSSREMLRLARKNVPGVRFVRGDMETFDLRRQFDVVLCLFSAIGYARTYPRLGRTLKTFAGHLLPGGVVIIEPWLTKSTAEDGYVHALVQGSDDLKVVRVDYTRVKGSVSVLDERVVVAKKGAGITVHVDRMTLGLFEKARFLGLMRDAGLDSRYLTRSLSPGRGLYVGTKRQGDSVT